MDLWAFDDFISSEGYELICGVDEAGRGPLAGPVFAAAVILPRGLVIPGINDSKKLTANRRAQLYPLICSAALTYGVARADVCEIERLNIQNAAYLAMSRAVAGLYPAPDLALIDGGRYRGDVSAVRCVIGGDARSASIAAASVLAKVSRDRYMAELSVRYPQYGFERHKGYGTSLHYDAIRRHGPSPEHRISFLRTFYKAHEKGNENTEETS